MCSKKRRLAYKRAYRKAHPEQRREYKRAWARAHPEKIAAYSAKWQARRRALVGDALKMLDALKRIDSIARSLRHHSAADAVGLCAIMGIAMTAIAEVEGNT